MAKSKITEIVAKIVDLLTPLKTDERQRVIQASLTLVGEGPNTSGQSVASSKSDQDLGGLSSRAQTWMRQNGLTLEVLQQVFHIEDGKVEVIASEVPGKGDKGKSLNAYILKGISQLLTSGDPSFDDKSARALCKEFGCYNDANHSVYMKDKGNEFAGSKEGGWKLTSPGLRRGAILLKEMAKGS